MFERSPTIGWWFWTDRRTSAGFYRSRLLFWTSLANMFNPDYVSPNFQHKRAQNLRRCIRLCTHMVGLPLITYLARTHAHKLCQWLSVTPIDNRPNTTHIFSERCPSCVYILCSWSVSQARLLYFPFCAYLVLHTYPSGTKFLVSVRVHTFTYVKTSSTQ